MPTADTIRIDLVTDPLAVVPKTREITAGTGLSGGGDLSTDRSLSLSTGSQASLAKADAALPKAVAVVQVADRTALKALDTTVYTAALLIGDGIWFWKTGDYSSQVTGDANEGAYVKATAIASTSGAWVREGTGKITTAGDAVMSLKEGASGEVWYNGRNLTGSRSSGTSGLNLALGPTAYKFDVRYDDSDCGTDFSRGLFGRVVFGGSAAKGGRIGTLGVVLHNNGVTNSSNLNRNYVGVLGLSASDGGDGGTNLTSGAKGAYFGINGVVELHSGATNVFNATGAELNVYGHASATARYVTGLQIAGFCNADPGGSVFAALTLGGGSDGTYTHVGWEQGILFTDFNGATPVKSDTTLFGHYWTGGGTKAVSKGIDLSGFTFSSFAFKSTNFEVDGDGLIKADRGQIRFPATQVASSDANTLDDYEEGTWTPVFTCLTPGDLTVAYASQAGRYVKIGKTVTLWFDIQLSTYTYTTATGSIRLTGVPFTAANATTPYVGSVAFGNINKAGYTQVVPRIEANAVIIRFVASGMGSGVATVNATDAASGNAVFLQGCITYEAAA